MIDYSARRILYIIFVLALATRLLSGLFFLNANKGPEVFEYETIANNILNGKGFLYTFYSVEHRAFIQPFYPIFTAIIYYLTNHNWIVMLVIQSILSSALCFIIFSIAIKMTGEKEALLAAALIAFHPGITIYSILKLHPLVFDIFFYLLTINLLLRFIQQPNNKNAVLTGAFIGVALLSRSTILAFIIFSFIYIFFILRDIAVKTRLRYLLIIGASAIIIYSPWVIRNYKVFGNFVFIQTSSGENLWLGNNKEASGSAILPSGKSVHTMMSQEMRENLEALDELGQARYYKKYFLDFIKKEPLLFIQLFIKKFYYFWWFAPHTGVLYSRLWLHVYRLYYGGLFLLFISGCYFVLRDRTHGHLVFMLFMYMLSIAFLHAVVNVDTRHRWAIEPIMIIFSSAGIVNLIRMFKKGLKRA